MKYFYKLSIIAAILFSNSAFGSVITVNPAGGADHTTLSAALTAASNGDTISVSGTITADGVSGEGIVVNKNVVIIGQGADNTIIEGALTQNTANRRVFTVYAGKTVSIQNLTIRHGKTGTSGYPAQWGGGIMNYGILTVDNCVLKNNNASSSGGAIYNDKYNQPSANGNLTVTNSSIINNVGGDYGSGICNGYFGTVMVLTNCTFFGNTGSAAIGLDRSLNSYITNCTVSGNSGGLWTYAGGNNLYLKNSIVAANTGNDFTLLSGASVIESYNIVETSSGYTFTGTGTLTGTQPYLELSNLPESNNSFNPTTTLALYTASVAIDAGSSASPNGIVNIPCKDQRGYLSNGTKDMGSYEFDGATNVPNGIIITSQPLDQSTCFGSNAIFSISSNAQNIQWRKDGNIIPGATNPDLIITNVDSNSIGTYDCLLYENCGLTSSDAVSLSTILDSVAPGFDVISLPTIYGSCGVTSNVSAPTATDNCSGSVTATTADPTSYNSLGSYTINWEYADLNGNSSIQTQEVIISDSVAPVPQFGSLPQINASCSVVLIAPMAIDACAGGINATTNDPTNYSTQGNYTVTWNYNDGNGNVSTQTQEVIISDNLNPVPDVTNLPDLTEACGYSATAPTATDACVGQIAATSASPTSFSSPGNYIIVWEYSDGNGNNISQSQNVTINDNLPPVPLQSSLATVTGYCNVDLIAPTASDNCAGPLTATTSDPTNYSSPGTYTVSWSYDDGNGNIVSQNQQVIVNAMDTSIRTNYNSLQANNTGATSYQWLNCDDGYSEITGANSSLFTPAQSGYYSLRIGINNCIDTSSCYYISVLPTGIDTKENNSLIEIYPNPTTGVFNIRSKSQEKINSYFLINNLGEIVIDIKNAESNSNEIDLSNYPTGIYYIKLFTDKSVLVKKIILK